MGAVRAVVFALLGTSLEIIRGVLGAPPLVLVTSARAILATSVLLVTWHPLAIAASCGL